MAKLDKALRRESKIGKKKRPFRVRYKEDDEEKEIKKKKIRRQRESKERILQEILEGG